MSSTQVLPPGTLRNPKPIGVGYVVLGGMVLLVVAGCTAFLLYGSVAELTTFEVLALLEAGLIGLCSIANGIHVLRHRRQSGVLRSISVFAGVLFIGTMMAENRLHSGS